MVGILSLFIAQTILCQVSSFPGGGPYKSCANLYPKHQVNAQTTIAPYTIDVTPLVYRPGDIITVTLSGKNGATFKGFMIRANSLVGNTEQLVGQFIEIPDKAVGKFWYPEGNDHINCVTHSSAEVKKSVTLKWQAPNITVGDIQFFLTFVKEHKTFWVLTPSAVVTANEPLLDVTFNGSISTHFNDIDLDSQCGVTKGCMLYPSFCSGADCSVAVTFKSHKTGVDFEAMAISEGYLTFAISEDGLMGNDETITCMVKNEYVSVQHGFNPAYYNDRHSIVGITNIETKREDGKLLCRWTMPYVNNITHIIESKDKPIAIEVHTFDLRQEWRLFLAWGNLYAGADVLAKHQELPLVSMSKVNLLENNIVRGNGFYLPMKIHGSLMLIGFMALIGVGVVISRHYKHCFAGDLLGTKMWFQLHRAVSICAVLCILTGFVLIFVELKSWTSKSVTHAILGTLTIILVVIQTLFGILRPRPTSSIRPLFNWSHRINGKVTQILSSVTIVMAFYTPYINHQLLQWLAVTIGVWIGVQIFWELVIFEVYKCSHFDTDITTDDNMDMKELNALNQEGTVKMSCRSKKFLQIQFIVYCIFIFGITLISVTFIFMF